MANTVKGDAGAPRALLDAAKALLPERLPSSVTGRELAERAGVNYGLVHHYFGRKDNVFRAALLELRDEFLATHPERDLPALVVEADNPYLLAIGRSQVDYPSELGAGDDFPIGDAMVSSLRERIRAAGPARTEAASDIEAKARAVALLCLQIGYGTYRAMLLDTVGAGDSERPEIEHALQAIYAEVARPS